MPTMELRHLRYFVGVAQYHNYSEPSRRLHVAQPAISQTILDLEEELSVKLLLRTKRAVQLTAAGTAFLREAQEILRRANEAQHLAQRAARGEVGTLGIGFFGAASAPILPALIQAYRRAFPDVELHLFEMNPDQQFAAFDEGRIHLGFTRTLPPDRRSQFEEELVYTDRLVIALPATHALAKQKVVHLKTLAGEPFVQFNGSAVSSGSCLHLSGSGAKKGPRWSPFAARAISIQRQVNQPLTIEFYPLGCFTPLQSSTLSAVAARLGVTPMEASGG